MKTVVLLLALIASQSSWGDTLTDADLPGIWRSTGPPTSWLQKLEDLFSADREPRMTIVVAKSGAVHFTRLLDDGRREEFDLPPTRVRDDLWIIDIPKEGGMKYRLVLSGWNTAGHRKAFGFFYLYGGDELVNGWPVSFDGSGTG